MDIDTKTSKLFRNKAKRRAWIIYQLALTDRSLASIAREAGISRQAVWQALIKPYPRAEKIIAESLNLTPETLFPERYDSSGVPNRKRGRPPTKK
ncbi:MAG: helix-turn-helix domain-containing protein [Gammaproteobacteria bacterium]|nr:helix-turn-helix domain-containing protein [Gammaproteobacteria bacterium]